MKLFAAISASWRLAAALVSFCLTFPQSLSAQLVPGAPRSLIHLTIEELMSIDITSVSREEESLGSAAAAVAVVTNEDIRRTGAQTIPEALRMVPGIFVGRRNANTWAVSSRGFTRGNSEKLLVLSDTRSIYTPLFSGVFWDVQNYVMEDIERIEVIRGPGAALWGSNAVNGVINITTKSSEDTQGLYLDAGGGNEEQVNTAARYGGRIGANGHYRVFGRYFQHDQTPNPLTSQSDEWRIGHVGFRTDWKLSRQDTLTVQSDAYTGQVGQFQPSIIITGRPEPEGDLEIDVAGGNILARWQHAFSETSGLTARAYYDRTDRNDPSFDDSLDTGDVDLQHNFLLTETQQLTWGANYRFTLNTNHGKGLFNLDPDTAKDSLVGAFIQDQIALSDAFTLTLGTKLEHNEFSGFEVQPSVRAAWEVTEKQVLWGAVSRAVRVPTRLERDIAIDLADAETEPLPRLLGNGEFGSERLVAYELGYRWQPLESLAFDLAAFYNDYDKLGSLEIGDPFMEEARTVLPVFSENFTEGHGEGAEALISYSPLPSWRLAAMYSYLELTLHPNGMDVNRNELAEGSTPRHQVGLRSYLDLPGGLELDMQLRSLSKLRSTPDDPSGDGIPAYAELDVRLGWHVSDNLELSVLGRNLLDDSHPEYGPERGRGEIERSVFGRLTYRY